jgi:hypothetical protein
MRSGEFGVPIDLVEDLLQQCITARRTGMSFPEVWNQILSRNSLIGGPLKQGHKDGKPFLEVQLITGSRLVCDESGYSIK